MPETKLRQFVRRHENKIIGGVVGVSLATAYLMTVSIAARAAAKEATRTIKRFPVTVRVDLNEFPIAEELMKHMTVDENAVAARILQGIVDVQRGAEVVLDARGI